MNLFYVFIVPGSILKHLGEFGKIRLPPRENTRFLPQSGQYGYIDGCIWMGDYQFIFF